MELNVNISGVVLLVIALASIAGGLVLYFGSRRVGWRAVSMSAVALGLGVLLVFAVTLPVTIEGEAPEPVIADTEADQFVGTSLAGQGPGSPAWDTPPGIPVGVPLASLTYEGAVYHQSPLSYDEAARFNEDDLELAGSTNESNTLSPGGGESLAIYKLKDGDTNHVYVLNAGFTLNIEGDGPDEDDTTITIEAEWVRWVAADSNRS